MLQAVPTLCTTPQIFHGLDFRLCSQGQHSSIGLSKGLAAVSVCREVAVMMSGMSFVLLFEGGSSRPEAVSANPVLSKPKGQVIVGVPGLTWGRGDS